MELFLDYLRKNKLFVSFFLFISLLQVFFILKFPAVYESDSLSYLTPAQIFLGTGSFYSDVRTPLYPIFLAAAEYIFGSNSALWIITIQHIIGIIMWVIAYNLLKENRNTVIMFSILWCFDLLFNSYQHVILPDFMLGFFLFMSACSLKISGVGLKKYLISGLFTALALLTKPIMYLFFIAVLPCFYFSDDKIKNKIKKYILFAIFPIVAINLNCLNNYIHTSKYNFLSFQGSYSFFSIINFVEAPENSSLFKYFDKSKLHRNMDNEEKLKVSDELHKKMVEDKIPTDILDKEFKRIFLLSVIKHPIIFAKKTFSETAHFFLNANNQYAKQSAKDLPFSLGKALSEKNYAAAFRKMVYSLHPLYWALFILFCHYVLTNAKSLFKNNSFFECYMLWTIAYVTLITVLTCQGDARYRLPLQPFMLIFGSISLSNIYSVFKKKQH